LFLRIKQLLFKIFFQNAVFSNYYSVTVEVEHPVYVEKIVYFIKQKNLERFTNNKDHLNGSEKKKFACKHLYMEFALV